MKNLKKGDTIESLNYQQGDMNSIDGNEKYVVTWANETLVSIQTKEGQNKGCWPINYFVKVNS